MTPGPACPVPPSWPAMSLRQAQSVLTAPGAPFEMEELAIGGVKTRTWKHAPPTLAALCERVGTHAARIFSVYEEERISFDAQHRAVSTIARWLMQQGVRQGDRIALAMRNLPEWPVIFFATTAVGAVIVPLNAWWSGLELTQAMADCGAQVLFCDGERLARVEPLLGSCTQVRTVVAARTAGAPAGGILALEDIIGRPMSYRSLPTTAFPPANIDPDSDAAIFYTSGTTGNAKGALATHRNIMTNIVSTGYAAARNILRRGEPLPVPVPRVRLITVPLFHVTGCVSMMSGMLTGNTLIFMRKWDPPEALRLIERERVNITGGVPTIVSQLLDHPDRAKFDLSSLELIAYGGAPGSPELVRRIRAELGAMPGTGWGMTETVSTVTALSAEDYLLRPDSCGPPVAVAELKIVDPGGSAELPTGMVGELWAKGPMVVKGYWNNPEATAATFVGGWVRTGDLAKLDEAGFCTIVDRIKDVIIRGGENIYSTEVENAIKAHPAVTDAALIGLPHPTLGEEPAGVVQLAHGTILTEYELRSWLRERVASFKVPARVAFIEEDFPRNASGKIVKAGLHALFE